MHLGCRMQFQRFRFARAILAAARPGRSLALVSVVALGQAAKAGGKGSGVAGQAGAAMAAGCWAMAAPARGEARAARAEAASLQKEWLGVRMEGPAKDDIFSKHSTALSQRASDHRTLAEGRAPPHLPRNRCWRERQRMEFDFSQVAAGDRYKLMSASITPRPIAWVTSRSAAGVANAAPFSFFNMVAADPPLLAIGFLRQSDGRHKDTPANILKRRNSL
jgi:hypothetical protein